jgi:CRP/FNR family transcriptional regulator
MRDFTNVQQPHSSVNAADSLADLLRLPIDLDRSETVRMDRLVSNRRRLRRGQALFMGGDPFTSIYAIRAGFFKTRVTAQDGRDQVTGFLMSGELMGLDGIGTERHTCDAVALEDSEICAIPFSWMEALSHESHAVQHYFHKVLSREIARDHAVMLLLGSMRAEERLATFILNLGQRMHARGFSSTELVLRMTREDIGSFLGLKLETISRMFSKFQDDGLMHVDKRNIRIRNADGLRKLVNTNRAC